MSTIKRNKLTGRALACRHRLLFDRLESRTALSGTSFDPGFSFTWPGQTDSPPSSGPLAITSATPDNASTLDKSPTTLTVTFNKGLDGFSIGITDFSLVQVNQDGTKTTLNAGQVGLLETLDLSSPSGNQIDLSLSHGLEAGRYQLVLNASNRLAGTDGSLVSANGQNLVVTDFTIASPSSANQAAINLGVIGGTVVAQTSSFDMSSSQPAVKTYTLSLAPGHRWSLGLAVTSENSESQTTLSLYDANHTLIASDSVGLQNDPQDPYLFAGLDPGTYYVGVSVTSANDPHTWENAGATGSSAATFQLQAVANTADQPTVVLGTRVDHADPLSTNPTGLTLQFSGGLQLAGLELPTTPPLKLVDQNGVSWGVTTAGYNAALGQLQLVFNQALPVGIYTVELTSPTSLLDLANAPPQGKGLPAGELASFSVTSAATLPQGDLGPLYPGAQGSTSSTGTSLKVGSGSAQTLNFTVIEPGVYAIEGISPSSGLTYTLTDHLGSIVASGPSGSLTGVSDLALKVGTYQLTVSNPNGGEVSTILSILHKQTVFSELMEGGIAQGAALSLRLVNPQANFGVADAGSSSSVTAIPFTGLNSTTLASASPPSDGGSSSAAAGSTATVSGLSIAVATPGVASGFGLLFLTGPVGLPSSQSNQISVVGSTGTNGTLALASNVPTLSAGLMGIPELNAIRARADARRSAEQGSTVPDLIPDVEPAPVIAKFSTTENGLLSVNAGSQRADANSLAGAEWISQLFARTVGWVEGLKGTRPAAIDLKPAEAQGNAEEVLPEPHLEAASFVSPVGIASVVFAMAYRYRRYFKLRLGSLAHAAKQSELSRRPHFQSGSPLSTISPTSATRRC